MLHHVLDKGPWFRPQTLWLWRGSAVQMARLGFVLVARCADYRVGAVVGRQAVDSRSTDLGLGTCAYADVCCADRGWMEMAQRRLEGR